MGTVLCIAYGVLGYWSVNKLFYENKVVVYTNTMMYISKKIILGIMFGWILIPAALIKLIFQKINGN